MNIILWILAGGVVGLVGSSALHVNTGRGLVIAVIISVMGAFLGGHELAPIFHGTTVNPGDFSSFALMIAFATAIACLLITDALYKRLGF